MKSIMVSLSFFAIAVSAQGQSLERQVIGTAGTFHTAPWGSLSSTGGETAVTTLTASSNTLTQGFQQPSVNSVKVYNVESNLFTVTAYPNPAFDVIDVIITGNSSNRYAINLYDLPGRKLDIPGKEISGGTTMHMQFGIRQLAAATYVIVITDEHNIQLKAIKFTKAN